MNKMSLKKLVFIVSLLSIINSFCQEKLKNNFTLHGNIKNNYSGYIYLNYEDKVDSCIIKNNHFKFKGKINEDIVFASFSFKNKQNTAPSFYLEKSKIFIDLTIEDRIFKKNYKVAVIDIVRTKGTETSIIQKDYENFKKEFKDKTSYYAKMIEKVESIVNSYPKHPFSSSILFSLTKIDTLDKNRLIKIYEKLDKTKISKFYKKNIEKNIYAQHFVEVNDMIFNFELLDKNNLLFNTKSLKGKWVLIDFWASWCVPCRKQLPRLKKLYESNKKSNFEIIGVSIDEDVEKWKKALEMENLDWINVNENQGIYGKAPMKYNVNQIPMNFLINPEGRVIAKNISMEKLQKVLNEI